MKTFIITMTVLISVAATGLAEAKPTAKSNMSSKYNTSANNVVNNLRG